MGLLERGEAGDGNLCSACWCRLLLCCLRRGMRPVVGLLVLREASWRRMCDVEVWCSCGNEVAVARFAIV